MIEVRIDALSDANGADPRGHLTVDGAPPIIPYRGRVTCLIVVGNQATVGIEIVKSDDPAQEGRGQLWSLFDGNGAGIPDRIAGYPLTPTPPTVCPLLSFNVPIISGDYAINDAAP